MAWDKLADMKAIQETMGSLKKNGINSMFVDSGEDALKEVKKLIPMGREVFTMNSQTLIKTKIVDAIDDSEDYISIRKRLSSMSKDNEMEMKKEGAAPVWTVGSCHALTRDGKIMVASYTGSQMAAYVYGAGHVIFVVGAQKIVRNMDEGFKRINEYVVPLEDKRVKSTGGAGSAANKLLVINREIKADRITVIIVGEVLGF